MKKLSYYRNRADRLLQNSLTALNPRCLICGRPVSCMHHFFPKSSASALRYEEDNLIPVCVGCHLGFHSARSSEFIGKTIEKRGNEWFKGLMKKKSRIIKPNKSYYQSIINFYGKE